MIIHVDMDAFYASVEEREQPSLKGKPLIVGGRPEARGVVAAANYASRIFGVRSAMPTARAVKLCPHLLILPPRGALYSQVSDQIHGIFARYTPVIEPLSLDEAFLDATGSEKLYGSVIEIGRRIKADILKELDLIASVGVAPNKFLAKLASDQDKPDGFTVIHPEEVQSFLDPLPVSRIWGVGKMAQARLQRAGIATIGALRLTSESFLQQEFGKIGERLWALSHGRDDRRVIAEPEAKSISREATFEIDITDLYTLESFTSSLTESVCFRLRNADLRAKTVQLKVRYQDFSTVTRNKTLSYSTDSTIKIWDAVRGLLTSLLEGRRFSVRLVGVGLTNFVEEQCGLPQPATPKQLDLFSSAFDNFKQDRVDQKQLQLDKVSDQIKHKYGKSTIRRGKSR